MEIKTDNDFRAEEQRKTEDGTGDLDSYEKTGYLREPCRMFHLRDCTEREFPFHYHDFYKIIYSNFAHRF